MLVRPIVQRLLGDVVLLLELEQQTVSLLAVELEQNVLQFLLLLLSADVSHQAQHIQLHGVQLRCYHRFPFLFLFVFGHKDMDCFSNAQQKMELFFRYAQKTGCPLSQLSHEASTLIG